MWNALTHVDEYLITHALSGRLKVLFARDELAEIRGIAKRQQTTIAEWVRQASRNARLETSPVDPKRRLAAVREAACGAYPSADMPLMLHEIEGGYLSDGGPEQP
jgi:hypothetical protein